MPKRNPCIFERNNGDIVIRRPDRKEIMFTTFREDYWDELTSQTWRLEKGYPTCSKLGLLHRYIMSKWYGREILEALTAKGYVVDHLDNEHNNCRVSNLEFLKKDFNTAKGQWLDKQVEEQQFHFALSIFKDFSTGCYQITIGMNDPVCRFLDDGTEQLISSVKFLYQEDYPVVILDAEMMLQNLEKNTFNPRKYHACAIRVYDCPRFELTEEERNGSIVIRGGQPFIILGNGHNWITRVAPDKNWIPPENGCVQFQIYQVKV